MMYNNLFNPNYKCDTKSREWNIRYMILYHLKHIIESCHKERYTVAKLDLEQFRGMLLYAAEADDINGMTFDFLYGITKQIARRYNLY